MYVLDVGKPLSLCIYSSHGRRVKAFSVLCTCLMLVRHYHCVSVLLSDSGSKAFAVLCKCLMLESRYHCVSVLVSDVES